jgi:flagellar assembly protein FliH
MATIIRKDSPRETNSGRATQPVSFNFSDMRGQANDYLGTVRAEAAKIVQEAHQQAEQIRRQAEVAGRKAAEAAAQRVLEEKVSQRMQAILPALERVAREVNDMKGELLANWERSAVKVATAIAERIIRRQIAREPQITLDLIAESLRLAAGAAEIKLHVSPADRENLGPQIDALVSTIGRLAPSAVVTDTSLQSGDCRVMTKFGEIDQQIKSQLRRIELELA